jgi:hypothetical protein
VVADAIQEGVVVICVAYVVRCTLQATAPCGDTQMQTQAAHACVNAVANSCEVHHALVAGTCIANTEQLMS